MESGADNACQYHPHPHLHHSHHPLTVNSFQVTCKQEKERLGTSCSATPNTAMLHNTGRRGRGRRRRSETASSPSWRIGLSLSLLAGSRYRALQRQLDYPFFCSAAPNTAMLHNRGRRRSETASFFSLRIGLSLSLLPASRNRTQGRRLEFHPFRCHS